MKFSLSNIVNLSTTSNAIVILPEVGQHAKEVLVFFENFVIDDRNGNLMNGLTGLKVRYNFPEICFKFLNQLFLIFTLKQRVPSVYSKSDWAEAEPSRVL